MISFSTDYTGRNIVLCHTYPRPTSSMLSGSVLDRLYVYIVIYHTYPLPIVSILSGSVQDRLYRDIVLYHTYPALIMSILSGFVLETLRGHRAISWTPNANNCYAGYLSKDFTGTSCYMIHTQRQ